MHPRDDELDGLPGAELSPALSRGTTVLNNFESMQLEQLAMAMTGKRTHTTSKPASHAVREGRVEEPTAFELMMAENKLAAAANNSNIKSASSTSAPAQLDSNDDEAAVPHALDMLAAATSSAVAASAAAASAAAAAATVKPPRASRASRASTPGSRSATSTSSSLANAAARLALRTAAPTGFHTVSRRGAPSRHKSQNEDRHCSLLRGKDHGRTFSFFGVFDGHNGCGTADYLAREFLNTHLCGSALTATGCVEGNSVETTLRRACASADDAILRRMRMDDDANAKIKRKVSRLGTQLDDSGSTAVFMLMAPRCPVYNLPAFATVGWVGDSIALLVSRKTGSVVLLNPPRTWHTMEGNAAERKRVLDQKGANGLVIGGRVLGLKVSRAFGDITAKEPVPLLTCSPSFVHFDVEDGEEEEEEETKEKGIDRAAGSDKAAGGDKAAGAVAKVAAGASPARAVADDDHCIILASDGLYDAFRGDLQRLGALVKEAAANPANRRAAAAAAGAAAEPAATGAAGEGSGNGDLCAASDAPPTVNPAALSAAIMRSAVASDDVTLTVVLLGPWHAALTPEEEVVAEGEALAASDEVAPPAGAGDGRRVVVLESEVPAPTTAFAPARASTAELAAELEAVAAVGPAPAPAPAPASEPEAEGGGEVEVVLTGQDFPEPSRTTSRTTGASDKSGTGSGTTQKQPDGGDRTAAAAALSAALSAAVLERMRNAAATHDSLDSADSSDADTTGSSGGSSSGSSAHGLDGGAPMSVRVY